MGGNIKKRTSGWRIGGIHQGPGPGKGGIPQEANQGPVSQKSGYFSGRKSHFKTMKPFMYRAFYVNRFCISAKLTLVQRFESKNLFFFQLHEKPT